MRERRGSGNEVNSLCTAWGEKGERERSKFTLYSLGGGGLVPSLHMYIKLTRIQHTVQNTEYRVQVKLMYIKIPVLVFYMAPAPGHPLLGPLKGVGPENQNFFEPKWYSLCCCHFRAQKKYKFSGPSFQGPSKWICLHKNHYVPCPSFIFLTYSIQTIIHEHKLRLGCPSKLVLIRNNRNWNQN